jgi:hypothetical protein
MISTIIDEAIIRYWKQYYRDPDSLFIGRMAYNRLVTEMETMFEMSSCKCNEPTYKGLVIYKLADHQHMVHVSRVNV